MSLGKGLWGMESGRKSSCATLSCCLTPSTSRFLTFSLPPSRLLNATPSLRSVAVSSSLFVYVPSPYLLIKILNSLLFPDCPFNSRYRTISPIMEAASTNTLTDFMFHSVKRMYQQQESISNTVRTVQALVAQVSELTQQIHQLTSPTAPIAPPAPPVPPGIPQDHFRPEPRLPAPENYAGEPTFCRTFLNKCSMHFALQPRTFATEESKVAFTLTLLSGKSALWGTAVWENQHPCCALFHLLSDEMKRVFNQATTGIASWNSGKDLHLMVVIRPCSAGDLPPRAAPYSQRTH
ncbi:uncharacterized protein LOC113092679 [Carassius auratus]|uniref:Uncharacterized protein LOC113092679 n=1 Tax=Carassius auratus TaxID=7957 RepID=A0A6P6P0A3_CARAU|nr:uncharacterized protein LOC113092679 [Carassius auratus]